MERTLIRLIALPAMAYAVLLAVQNLQDTTKQLGDKRVKDAREKTCATWKALDQKQPNDTTRKNVAEYCRPLVSVEKVSKT